MDEKTLRILKGVGRGLKDYIIGLFFWSIAIPILCLVAVLPNNRKNASRFYYNFVLERLESLRR